MRYPGSGSAVAEDAGGVPVGGPDDGDLPDEADEDEGDESAAAAAFRARSCASILTARRARSWYSGPCLRGSAYSRGLRVQ
jgi:hypothetical protein